MKFREEEKEKEEKLIVHALAAGYKKEAPEEEVRNKIKKLKP